VTDTECDHSRCERLRHVSIGADEGDALGWLGLRLGT
jgi:hypothetical protein